MHNTLRLGGLQVKLLLLVFVAGLPAFVLLFWLDLHDHQVYPILAAWLGALAMAMAAVWRLGGRWVSRRAATVCAVAQQIGAGKLGARTTFKTSPDELDQLGFAIDRMADLLERREQELLVSNRQLSEAQEEIRRMHLPLESKDEMGAEELARSLALQTSLFDSVPQLVWLADLDGSVTFANRLWSERIGVAPNDWKGDGWSMALHPEDFERVTREWREAVSSKDHVEIKFRLLHRDNEYHHYQANLQKALGKTGDAACWVGVCSDVTDSRHRDNALRVANQELQAFSSAISHDLRAPLRAITGFSECLQLESAGRLDEKGRHYLERIRVGAARMSELIDDLLSFSRVTRTDITVGKVDLSKLAQQVFDELRQLEPDRPVEIVIQGGMTAIGDASLLRVVLVNLIGNALKFSRKRVVSQIEVGVNELPGDTSMFFVRDNGAGFDQAYVGKIFGIFQRLHSAKEFPGRGIGLATVQRIIHKHGGRVSAEGAVDQGAKICFWLRRK
jgi:PAS domain S-box-containing protein